MINSYKKKKFINCIFPTILWSENVQFYSEIFLNLSEWHKIDLFNFFIYLFIFC